MSYSYQRRPHTQPQIEPWGGFEANRTANRSPFSLATQPSLETRKWDSYSGTNRRSGRITFGLPSYYHPESSNKMSSVSNYPLMDTLNSAMFRLSLEDLVDLERKRRCGMTRSEILNNIYCPAAGHTDSTVFKPAEAKLSAASAVCIDGSRAALALSFSNNARNVDARRQEAIRTVIEKSEKSKSKLPSIMNSHTSPCARSEHKNFVVISHGFPIDPDYAIMSKPMKDFAGAAKHLNLMSSSNCNTPINNNFMRPKTASSSKLVDLEYKNSVTALATPARQRRSAPPSTTRPKANNTSRRHLKLFRKKTFLVNEDANKAKSEDEQEVANGNDKLRIVQFNQETALSKSIRRKASSKLEGDHTNNNGTAVSQDHLPLAVSPRFNWKDIETSISSVNEEQLTRQLIGLHRAMTHKDKSLLNQLVKQGVEMSLPLRGVTALSLTLYLRHTDMTAELLVALRRTRQLARAINLPSVDNASRREPPLVTASRMGLLEAAALLVTHGADLEARDGQGRTALWHAVREEEDGIVEMLIHAGAKVYYENEDLSCPTQLACKTALLKHRGRQMVKMLIRHGANIEYVDHALRNALYWSVYNCCSEIAVFLLDLGVKVKPWSWFNDEALPASFMEDALVHARIVKARQEPHSLSTLARREVRNLLSEASDGRSIIRRIHCLDTSEETKAFLSIDAYCPKVNNTSIKLEVPAKWRKLKKVCNETKV